MESLYANHAWRGVERRETGERRFSVQSSNICVRERLLAKGRRQRSCGVNAQEKISKCIYIGCFYALSFFFVQRRRVEK